MGCEMPAKFRKKLFDFSCITPLILLARWTGDFPVGWEFPLGWAGLVFVGRPIAMTQEDFSKWRARFTYALIGLGLSILSCYAISNFVGSPLKDSQISLFISPFAAVIAALLSELIKAPGSKEQRDPVPDPPARSEARLVEDPEPRAAKQTTRIQEHAETLKTLEHLRAGNGKHEAELARLKDLCEQQDHRIQRREMQIEKLYDALTEHKTEIIRLNKAIVKQHGQIVERDRMCDRKDDEIDRLQLYFQLLPLAVFITFGVLFASGLEFGVQQLVKDKPIGEPWKFLVYFAQSTMMLLFSGLLPAIAYRSYVLRTDRNSFWTACKFGFLGVLIPNAISIFMLTPEAARFLILGSAELGLPAQLEYVHISKWVFLLITRLALFPVVGCFSSLFMSWWMGEKKYATQTATSPLKTADTLPVPANG